MLVLLLGRLPEFFMLRHAVKEIIAKVLAVLLLTVVSPVFAEPPKKIVSIGGGLTEIIYALDAQASLVGSDTTSYYPAAAEELPKVGYLRQFSAEGVLSLSPDAVFLSSESGPATAIEQLKLGPAPLYFFDAPKDLNGVKFNILRAGKLLNRQASADKMVATMDEKYAALNASIANRSGEKKPRIMFILNHSGVMLVAGTGTAADTVIRLAGGMNAVEHISNYKMLTPESAVTFRPDIILITDQGLQQSSGSDELMKSPGIALTPAAQYGRIVSIDALLLLGLGPRVIDAALQLHKQIYAQ